MRDDNEQPEAVPTAGNDEPTTRRSLLRMSALGAATVMTIRPGIAQGAVSSALTCSIPVPLAADVNKWLKPDGTVTTSPPPNNKTYWKFPASPQSLPGEDVKNAIKYDTNLPGMNADKTDAYKAYINAKITSGKPGFTCYASLQSPNRF
jgi:hypothetical protein